MATVVIDHHYDDAAGVYRLTVGHEVWQEFTTVDDEGEPATERIMAGHAGVEDFVWHAEDERWRGLSRDEVARAQRVEVYEALEARLRPGPAREVSTLPGVGEEL